MLHIFYISKIYNKHIHYAYRHTPLHFFFCVFENQFLNIYQHIVDTRNKLVKTGILS